VDVEAQKKVFILYIKNPVNKIEAIPENQTIINLKYLLIIFFRIRNRCQRVRFPRPLWRLRKKQMQQNRQTANPRSETYGSNDRLAIFTADAQAKRAADYLHGLQPAPNPDLEPDPEPPRPALSTAAVNVLMF
jgi:hypothetical protein